MSETPDGVTKRTTFTSVNLTNTDVGPRGIFTKTGQVVLNPGESKDVELDQFELDALPEAAYFVVNEPLGGKPPEPPLGGGEDTGSGTEGGALSRTEVSGGPGKDHVPGKDNDPGKDHDPVKDNKDRK